MKQLCPSRFESGRAFSMPIAGNAASQQHELLPCQQFGNLAIRQL
jgi:hypothetical protein